METGRTHKEHSRNGGEEYQSCRIAEERKARWVRHNTIRQVYTGRKPQWDHHTQYDLQRSVGGEEAGRPQQPGTVPDSKEDHYCHDLWTMAAEEEERNAGMQERPQRHGHTPNGIDTVQEENGQRKGEGR